MITTDTRHATGPQLELIRNLAAERPAWQDQLNGQPYETVFDILGNVGNPDPKFVSLFEAKAAIKALFAVAKPTQMLKPTQTLKSATTGFIELQTLLRTLQVGHYALPRKVDDVLDFFEIIERPDQNGKPPTRWVNRLLGYPGTWNRDKLSINLQAAAARAISGDWVASAKLYATHFQTCARCDAPLSNPRSRAAKVGHDCAKIWGWKW